MRCNGAALSPYLRACVLACLRAGWPQTRILKAYPVGPGNVLRLSKENRRKLLKARTRAKIHGGTARTNPRAAVARKERAAVLQRRFLINCKTVQAFRRAIGDTEDRRHWTKLSGEQIERATAMLRDGEKWLYVAGACGVSLTTLQKHVAYRKKGESDHA